MLGLGDGLGNPFDGSVLTLDMALVMIAAALVAALFPNTQQIMENYRPATNFAEWRGAHEPLLMWRWRPNAWGFAFAGAAFFCGLMMIQRGAAVFLYFNF